MPSAIRSLFLPDILPCPGPGRCDFHAAIFGNSTDPKDIPKTWKCERCQKTHPTTVEPLSVMLAESPSRLEALPTELIQHIITYLPLDIPVMLGCASRTLHKKVGSNRLRKSGRRFFGDGNDLERDTPAWAPCEHCEVFRPYTSELAWPYLKIHREKRHVPSMVYGLSFFLDHKVTEYHKLPGWPEICSSLLTCAGTCHKPLSPADRATLVQSGFDDDMISDLGLPIQYNAEARAFRPNNHHHHRLVVHVQYRLRIPAPWTSFTIAERYAILREFYLCPHTYASKVQHRDYTDPTYPADSSIVQWLPHQGPVPEAQWVCSQCPSEFASNFNSKDDQGRHQMVFDVWKTTMKQCNDGMAETTLCKNAGGTEMASWKNSRIKTAFEIADPI